MLIFLIEWYFIQALIVIERGIISPLHLTDRYESAVDICVWIYSRPWVLEDETGQHPGHIEAEFIDHYGQIYSMQENKIVFDQKLFDEMKYDCGFQDNASCRLCGGCGYVA